MGKVTEFSIVLETNRQVFYSGENITGHLRLVVNKPLKFRGLTVSFHGKGYCHWTETHGSGDNRRTESYTGRQELFNFTTLLSGHPKSASSSCVVEMPAGTHVFPFAYQLPPNLPTSYEGSRGHIRYTVVGCIDKPWKFDHHTRRIITVNEVIDTNLPQYMGIVNTTEEKVVGCLCCLAGPVSVTAQVDRKAYCPGEMIYITAHCDNRSSRNMTAMRAKLIKTVTYRARSKSKRTCDTVATLEGPPIPPRQFADWTNQGLLIPAIAPTILGCNVLEVSYAVQVHIDIPMAVDLRAMLPVVIGTVPFQATYMNPSLPPIAAPSFISSNVPPPPVGVFGYPDMAPPTYAQAIDPSQTMTEDEVSKRMHNDMPYAPMYTYAYPHAPPPQ